MDRAEAIEHLISCIEAADNDGYIDEGRGAEALEALGVSKQEQDETRARMTKELDDWIQRNRVDGKLNELWQANKPQGLEIRSPHPDRGLL